MARGDREAFDLFYHEYFYRIYRYLLVMAGGQEEPAREALQEGMIRIVRYMKPLPDAGALWNWLRRVLRSAFIDQLRRAGEAEALALEQAGEPAAREPDDADEVLLEHLRACLAGLPAGERRLVEGKYLEGRSYAELAATAGLTERAVESRLARARRKLRAGVARRLRRDHG